MEHRPTALFVSGMIALFLALCLAGWVVDVYIAQPLNHISSNHNSDFVRATIQDFETTAADYQAAQAQLPVDTQAVKDFMATHPTPWDDTTRHAYDRLQQYVQGDIVAINRLAAHYNSLATSPDTAGIRPANLPTRLDTYQP